VASVAKIRANRANARASTGPKTPAGRARSARNALRHALSLPVSSNGRGSEEVEKLALEIAGPDADAEILVLARRVAEAQSKLRRVRLTRHQFLSEKMSDPYYESHATRRQKVTLLMSLLRPNAPEMPFEELEQYVASTPKGPEKFAIVLAQESKALMAMERYEQRALSRRKFAIRELDQVRRQRLHSTAETT
jgi:hypothetical protein